MGASSLSPRPMGARCDVAVIGGGFSGTMVAVHLLRRWRTGSAPSGGRPRRLTLVERSGVFGPGVAYGTPNPAHLLNVPAGRMGAFADQPDHFLDWLRCRPALCGRFCLDPAGLTGAEFVSRRLYGLYLRELLAAEVARAVPGSLEWVADEALDLEPLAGGTLRLRLRQGPFWLTGAVVLAVGNFPPGDPALRDRHFHTSPLYLQSPWEPAHVERLARDPRDLLVLGSGLTGLDLILTLRARKTAGTVHVLSRRGLFPQPHRAGAAAHPAFVDPAAPPRTARALLRLVRAEVARAAQAGREDWRPVLDSLRPFSAALWQGFNLTERRRFLRHLRAYWESHRHRAAPQVLAEKDAMLAAGRLQLHRGRLRSLTTVPDGAAVEAVYVETTAAGGPETRRLRVGHVVNCTGPECNYHKLGDPLIFNLLARGVARPDPLFLGLETSADAAVVDYLGRASGRVFTIGSPRRGTLFETTAVPELRTQSHALAERLDAALAVLPPVPDVAGEDPSWEEKNLRPEEVYAFEI